ncbi:MAG TPA: DUF1254 domain-containing protein [Candidatus Tumulicola sp.]
MPVGAIDAYIWGYPLVLFDAAMRRDVRGHDASLTGVSLPNDDLAERIEWIDLQRGPSALVLVETTRYHCVSLFDAWGRNFASLGTRTTGNERQTYAIVPPLWNGAAPHGMQTIQSPTDRVAALGQTTKAGDDSAQPQFSIVPIGPRPNPRASNRDADFPRARESIAAGIASAGSRPFLACLQKLLHESERYAKAVGWRDVVDAALRKDPRELDDDFTAAIDLIESGSPLTPPVDGWQARRAFDARGSAYLERARACRFHFLTGDEQDVFHRFARSDDSGRALHGRLPYRLHFDVWNEPPARAFWSLSACDGRFGALLQSKSNSTVRSRDGLVRNADDSLDISIQSAPPDEPNVNWLAVPQEPFGLILRLYWPRPPALNGLWSPPALRAASVAA